MTEQPDIPGLDKSDKPQAQPDKTVLANQAQTASATRCTGKRLPYCRRPSSDASMMYYSEVVDLFGWGHDPETTGPRLQALGLSPVRTRGKVRWFDRAEVEQAWLEEQERIAQGRPLAAAGSPHSLDPDGKSTPQQRLQNAPASATDCTKHAAEPRAPDQGRASGARDAHKDNGLAAARSDLVSALGKFARACENHGPETPPPADMRQLVNEVRQLRGIMADLPRRIVAEFAKAINNR